jgi:hypothetical protein
MGVLTATLMLPAAAGLAWFGPLRLFRAERSFIAGPPPASTPRCAPAWPARRGLAGRPARGDSSPGHGPPPIRSTPRAGATVRAA